MNLPILNEISRIYKSNPSNWMSNIKFFIVVFILKCRSGLSLIGKLSLPLDIVYKYRTVFVKYIAEKEFHQIAPGFLNFKKIADA